MINRLLLHLVALITSAAAYVSIITGANGFVGRHVVYSLIQQHNNSDPLSTSSNRIQNSNISSASENHVIVCLVRPDKISYEESYWNAHLSEMQQCNAKVLTMTYDMLDNGETLNAGMDAAIKSSSDSCPVCIYHIASVFGPTPDPIQTAKDNVQSTEDAVRTLDKFYQKYPNIKPRLVVTSSMAAVRATDQTPLNGKYYTHRDWNTLSKLNKDNWGSCYQWSKAESERRAWELVKECNRKYSGSRAIVMVGLCPSFVFGPPVPMPKKMKDTTITPTGSSSYSLTLINQWLKGESPVQSRLCADVRDVAKAHIAAGQTTTLPKDDIDRRYILSTEERLSSELTAEALKGGVERAQNNHGGHKEDIDMSKITCDTKFTGGAIKIGEREVEASERLERDLGVVCRSVEETMQDMAEALLFGEPF